MPLPAARRRAPFELYYEIERTPANSSLRSRMKSNSSRRCGLGVRRLDHFNIQTEPDMINPETSNDLTWTANSA